MRIESATVENHRFGLSRRRGYDAAEVDAVMSRVADTLAQYERMLKKLQQPNSEIEDIKSIIEAQESKNRLIADAKNAAARIVDAATEEATAIRDEATITADRIIGAANDHLSEAQMDAQRIREEADSLIDLATSRSDELRSQADVILTSAIAEAEKVRTRAEQDALAKATEAEKMLHMAQAESNRLSAETAAQSDRALAEADAEVADVLAHARQQAEAMINAAMAETRIIRERAQEEIDEQRASGERHAAEIVARARNQAAEVKASAAATAEALTAQGRADAEEVLAEARSQALDRLAKAQIEAEAALMEASREADSLVAAAREDKRRLELRISELREAVADFEAHITNLATVAGDRTGLIADMIDQETDGLGTAKPATNEAPAIGPKRKGKRSPTTARPIEPVPMYAEPDGSGQLPVGRPVTSYSDPWHGEGREPYSSLDTDIEPDAFVYDGGTEEELIPANSIEEGVPTEEGTTGTIYQRRGGGIKRRVAAIRTPGTEEA